MFCPRCRAEYRPGFSRCKDCDADLVERLPESHEIEHPVDSDYIVVATVNGALKAEQILSFLEGCGIPTLTHGDSFRRRYGLDVPVTEPVQIFVPRNLAVTALNLLSKADRGELEIESGDSP